MARFSFGIFGQNSDELISGLDVKIKDGNSTIVADKSGNLSYTISDNGDGTYYVDSLPQALYTVYVGDSRQDELHNVFFSTETTNTHINDATKHRLINDSGTTASELFSASKINTLLATKSPTTHNHDSSYSATSHNHTGTYLDTGGNGVLITGSSASVDADANFEFSSGKLSIAQSYTGVSFVSTTNRIDQNLQALDSAIQSVDTSLGGSGTKKMVLESEVFYASSVEGNENTVAHRSYNEGSNTYKRKISFQFYKDATEDYLHVSGMCRAYLTGGAS